MKIYLFILLFILWHDSAKLTNQIEDINLGKIITPKNKRNTRNPSRIVKLRLYEKLLLKKRIKIEHGAYIYRLHIA